MSLLSAAVIDEAALDALKRHHGRQAEPYLVAAIFRDHVFRRVIVDAVDGAWRAVSVRTVFVHQTPQVTFPCAVGSCELGDALIVYRERLGPAQTRHQAVLFQAKKWPGAGRRW